MIARKIDSLGVDIIEAGSAITSDGERISIKEIAAAGLNAEICSYCRIRKEDIDAALECDVDSIHLVAGKPRLRLGLFATNPYGRAPTS